MRKIFRYVSPYKLSMAVALLLMGVELAVELIQPIIMGIIVDQGIEGQDSSTIIFWLAILLGLTLVAFAAGITSSYFAARVSQGVGHDIRKDLFQRTQEFSTLQMQTFTASSLLTRITNDVTQVQGFLFGFMRIMLRAPLFIIGGLIMSFTVHVQLATILVIVVPVLLVIMLWIMTKGIGMFQRVQKRLDKLNNVIRENLLGIKLVKAFNRNDHEQKRFKKENSKLMEDNKTALRFMELTMPIVMLGMNVGIVLFLWFGYVELRVGDAEPGEIVSILNYATRMMASFGVFGFLLMMYSRGKASASRINEVLETDAKDFVTVQEPQAKAEMNGSIRFDQVSFSYPNATKETLRQLSFHVKAGETVGVLGETGSGKSTFLQLIPRLYPTSDGKVYIDDQWIEEWGPGVRDKITLVPQEGYIFTGTLRENIAWGNEQASMDEIVKAAKDANIHDFIMTLTDQYETQVGQRGVNLSGGQKQRISIARALIANPAILLLDDSTSALDANTEVHVLKAIKERECTTIIVAQKISSVIDADHIMLLQHGQIVATGSHQELLTNNKLYKQIYKSQLHEEGLIDERY
ncbi:ABC transporter ATP-binding protein/permease [Aquibacillus koreensis]|uniref:ABC transporter ATP-binding protein/permease n=1 Tax=Aquibacillus koreensis TaxID=279446 RepID=A0A9X3WP64_9BACI|nr:ABC transporter ATP-binding protein [Aquibacillus koreensis]MCT2538157.1 ABC transporter ATP-binding protein/permease [Aquibacillus koreensis]MDC3420899.1 ABC transporter ATP-binding protein/permease [Aquibacillus koreensis]